MTESTDRKIVIIGGGVIGLSVAYHLAELGETDVLLVERNQLTSGTSWHAAGIVGPLRASINLTRLASYATELFPRLDDESGLSTGYQKTGGYWLASRPERMNELHRIAAMGDLTGINAELLDRSALTSCLPWLNCDDLAGALFVETDANANPVDICMAYARSARRAGVEILEQTACVSIESNHGCVTSIGLSDGRTINCKALVNCAGAWARHIGMLVDVPVPLQAAQHMYVVSEPIPSLPKPLPVIRDLDAGIYIKGDAGKAVLGGFEPDAIAWQADGQNGSDAFLELPEDWQQFEPFMAAGLHRMPALESSGIVHFMNGPESFTPDSKPIMGESPFLRRFYIAAGMNSTGMMSSAGIGRAMAEWVVADEAPMDLMEVDVARFYPDQNKQSYLHDCMNEAVANLFDMHWPHKQPRYGRNLNCLELHQEHKKAGAVFGSFAGLERPLWFDANKAETGIRYSFGVQSWWPWVERETKHLQQKACLFDLSPFSKFDISGPSAFEYLQYLFTQNIDVPVGRVVYGQMLNERGGIEMDLTVTRLSDSWFRITGGAPTRWRDLAYLQRHAADLNSSIEISDATDSEGVIGLMGPQSGAILSKLSGKIDLAKIPFSNCREFTVEGVKIRVVRLSFVGEFGAELYVAREAMDWLYKQLFQVAGDMLKPSGIFSIDACRIEKGYRHFGHDLGPDINPIEAGLGFCVNWKKSNFRGRDALAAFIQRGGGRRQYLFEVVSESGDVPVLLHDEPVYQGNRLVGATTSGARGFRTGKHLCFVNFRETPVDLGGEHVTNQYEVELNGRRYPLGYLPSAPYDPKNKRMLGDVHA